VDSDGLNKWLTLVANVAVVVGIIFLIVEINQNTAAIEQNATWMRLESLDNGTAQNREFRLMQLTNDRLFNIWQSDCGAGLDESDLARYRMMAIDYVIQVRTNGERSLALGGERGLAAHVTLAAPEIHACSYLRNAFEDRLQMIEAMSPRWYSAMQDELSRLDVEQ
jgi:hypothetical protein